MADRRRPVSMAARRTLAAFPLKRQRIVDFRIDPEQRARFKRCRRQWDFASPHRRGLEPVDSSRTRSARRAQGCPGGLLLPGHLGLAARPQAVTGAQGGRAVADRRRRGRSRRDRRGTAGLLRRVGEHHRRLRARQDRSRCDGHGHRSGGTRARTVDAQRIRGGLRVQGRPAGGGRRRRLLGRAAPDRRRLAGPGHLGARRGGDRRVLGVGAGLHGHGDRRHDPQRGAHRRAARPARTCDRPSARTGCPARGQRRRPVDSAASTEVGAGGTRRRQATGSTSASRGRCAAPTSVAPAARSRQSARNWPPKRST